MKEFSDRDRAGALGHRKVIDLSKRAPQGRRMFNSQRGKVAALVVGASVASAFATFTVAEYVRRPASPPTRAPPPVAKNPPIGFSAGPVKICSQGVARTWQTTCLVDGDTGWESGVKWRLRDVDTPEISSPRCDAELRKGIAARDRLQALMRHGYRINRTGSTDHYGRQLVTITLPDAQEASRVLLREGLAQPGPKALRDWCSR